MKWNCDFSSGFLFILAMWKPKYILMKSWQNKKVLLRERKRHTDRGISSTTWDGVPPPPVGEPSGQVWWGDVPEVGYPLLGSPGQVWQGVPKLGYPHQDTPLGQVWWGYPRWGTPLARSDGGYPRWGNPPLGYPPWLDLAGVSPPEPGWGTPPQVWSDRIIYGQTRVRT